jgi:transcriptional regulator with XRE-family HTH domain
MRQSFAQRLKQACDDHDVIPEYGHGRQAHIATRLKVSQEAVRKWFTGEAIPKREKIKALADLLEVDEAWLALGVNPEIDRREKHVHADRTDGAIYVVYGIFALSGGHCAFPSEKDPRRDFVDLYAIMGGVQMAVYVSVGREITKDRFEFVLPREFGEVRCIGFVYRGGTRFHLLNFSYNGVAGHLDRKGGGHVLRVGRDAGIYRSGSTHWPIIEDARDLA